MKHKSVAEERSISEILKKSFLRSMMWQTLAVAVIGVLVFIYAQAANCKKTTDLSIKLISSQIRSTYETYLTIADGLGMASKLTAREESEEKRKELLDTVAREYDLIGAGVIYDDGSGINDMLFRRDNELFLRALNGETSIGGPFITGKQGEFCMHAAAPMMINTENGEKICGVAFVAFKISTLYDTACNLGLRNDVYSYMMNSKDELVYVYDSRDPETVTKPILDYDTSDRIMSLTRDRMSNGEDQEGIILRGRELYYYRFAPVDRAEGESVCIAITFFNVTYTGAFLTILIMIFAITALFVTGRRSRKIAEDISKPLQVMSKNLKKVAETGYDTSIDVQSDYDGPLEYNIISEAMESIMNRLDVATSDNREFLDTAVLTDLVDDEILKYIHGYYKNIFGVNVVVADSKGIVIVGDIPKGIVDANALRDDESAAFIMVNDRIIGSTIFKIPEGCILDKADAQGHAVYVSKILEMVAFGNFRRSLQSRNKIKQTKEDLENLSEFNNEISELARQMASEGEKVVSGLNSKKYRETLMQFISFSYDVAARTEEMIAYSEGSNFSLQVHEGVYSVDDMLADVEESLTKHNPALMKKYREHVSENVPQTLYGDESSIRKLLEGVILNASDEKSDGNVELFIESIKNGYATKLSIRVMGNKRYSERDFRRIEALLEDDSENSGVVGYVGVNKLKIISFLRTVRRMNGEIEVKRHFTGEVEYIILIPQLEVEDYD